MNPRVKDVKPNPDNTLTLTFQNGEVKIFDMTPYLDRGIFKELQDKSLFNSVKPFLGSILNVYTGGTSSFTSIKDVGKNIPDVNKLQELVKDLNQ